MKLTYIAENSDKYRTIKEVLKSYFNMSDRLILRLKKLQLITLNGNFTYLGHFIKKGDKIECNLDFEEDNSNIVPTNTIKLDIIYEDEYYLVINKPSGIPVHPSINHYLDSLSNEVAFYFNKIGLKKKIRPINRLDKDTSGIVIFAKNEYVQENLVKQMSVKQFEKKYIAVINGNLELKEGIINLPITRKENSIIERCVSNKGQPSITHYKVLKSVLNKYDIIECNLETGRTHQIRVHFSYLGHPLLGDTLYGTPSTLISRQALHAYKVSFIHPILKNKVTYISHLPCDFDKIMKNSREN